ncbi:signal-transducing adaptor protein 2, partial [Anomalospiza imberbis]|uniref:signal-transducing adaptor protein 2 n=1 Tax=Anomalospiza imberbis TaxID=187417 RepID=UPI00358F9059
MERPVPLPRRTRSRLRHYYEGFVDKWGPRDQGYRRVWAGLLGLNLAFYTGPQDHEPLELLDLGELVTVQAEGGVLVLRLRGQEVTMKTESWETQEMWRGFILTMAKMKMPQDLALLPGHNFQLLQALREEQERRDIAVAGGDSGGVPRVPSCFFQVTRAEAERLLEQSAGRGNLLLRPGGHGQGVSVTTRQELDGTALLRHYRVRREDQGYVIDVETPHRCSSLAEVAQFFVRRSKGSLQPLEPEYSAQLEFVPMEGGPPPAAAALGPALRR